MTKAQKEKRNALNSTIFLIIIAVIVGSAIVNIVNPKPQQIIVQSTPAQESKVSNNPYTSDFPPFVQYFRHYQVKYIMVGDRWTIASVSLDDEYQYILNVSCDGLDNNDEGQNCILIGTDQIKEFFERLIEIEHSTI